MASPVSGFATGWGDSQARPLAPWAEPPWVSVAVSPSLQGLPFEMKTVLTAQALAIHGSATYPMDAQGLREWGSQAHRAS